jgi:hypothetical protein
MKSLRKLVKGELITEERGMNESETMEHFWICVYASIHATNHARVDGMKSTHMRQAASLFLFVSVPVRLGRLAYGTA